MTQSTPVDVVRSASTWSIVWGVLLIILGMLAIADPLLAAVAANTVLAWLIVLAGVLHIVLAFHAHGAGSVIWKLLVGVAYLFIGGYLIFHPLLGVATWTLLLAVLFLLEGIFNIVLFLRTRPWGGSIWLLLDGLITLLLGLMIYMHWPGSSLWAIGVLVGVSLITSGITRVMFSLAARKAVSPV